MINHQFDVPTPTSGSVTIKRDQGTVGSACSIRLFVQGEPVADIDAAEKVVLHLQPGDHIVSAQPQGLLCPGAIVEATLSIAPHGSKMMRVGFSASMDLVLQPTAF